jgi:hypothetical protein
MVNFDLKNCKTRYALMFVLNVGTSIKKIGRDDWMRVIWTRLCLLLGRAPIRAPVYVAQS